MEQCPCQNVSQVVLCLTVTVQDVPPQIQYLVTTLQTEYSQTVDFENDWKLLTLLIGANDLCVCCDGRQTSIPIVWQSNLRSVLQLIQQSIPRVFVNLVTIFNISGVWYQMNNS